MTQPPLRTPFRIGVLLGFLLSTLSVAAGERLGAPTFDNSSETTYRGIKWADFRGGGQAPPGTNRWNEGSFAHILCVLRIGGYKIEARQEGDEWVAVAAGIRPYAVMDKFHSAVRQGSRNDYSLAHEQIHFDIAELSARRLAAEMIAFEGRGEFEQEARRDLEAKILVRFEKGRTELRELQLLYDGETKNAQSRKKQKKWAEKVKEMFREATADLVEALEQDS